MRPQARTSIHPQILDHMEAPVTQNDENSILTVSNLSTRFTLGRETYKAVDGVSFDIVPGECLGIVGESGSGKSVTALSLLGLVSSPPGEITSGSIHYRGENLLKTSLDTLQHLRGNRIAYVFQNPLTTLNPLLTAGAQIRESLKRHQRLSGAEMQQKVIDLLKQVQIPNAEERARAYPHELSGGMRQRVGIAMALANDPEIIIADEPTTALDVTIQAQILELMDELKEKTKSSIIIITHDLGVVAKYADRVMVMYAGKPVEFSDVNTVFYKPCHPYTLGLMKSITRLDEGKKDKLKPIEGTPPSLIDLPRGCTFRRRCEYSIEECKKAFPDFVGIEKGHFASCYRASEFLSGSLSRD